MQAPPCMANLAWVRQDNPATPSDLSMDSDCPQRLCRPLPAMVRCIQMFHTRLPPIMAVGVPTGMRKLQLGRVAERQNTSP